MESAQRAGGRGARDRSRARRTAAGFSVMELLITMVVMSIIAAIAYVRVAPTLERARVRNAANVLATDLQFAQLAAAKFRIPVVVTVNGGAKEYQIANRGGDQVFRVRRFGPDTPYALGEFTPAPTILEMFPNGLVAQTANYTLGLDDFKRRVTITRAGQITIANVP